MSPSPRPKAPAAPVSTPKPQSHPAHLRDYENLQNAKQQLMEVLLGSRMAVMWLTETDIRKSGLDLDKSAQLALRQLLEKGDHQFAEHQSQPCAQTRETLAATFGKIRSLLTGRKFQVARMTELLEELYRIQSRIRGIRGAIEKGDASLLEERALLEKKLWLTCDETEAFFRRLTKWEAAFLEARSALVIAHQRLVPFCANRFRESSMAFEDLVQEGFVALTMAVENYQPHVSKFSTFASKVIHSAMIRAIDEQGHLIRIPVHACEKIRKIRKQSEALQKDLGRDATDSEIAFACNLPSEKVRELRAAAQKPLSLDAPRENPEETDADSIYEPSTPRDNANPPPDEHSEGSLRVVNERLGRLAPEHREIVERIFGLGGSEACSVQEAAPLFGKTERQIRAILSKAFTVMAAHAPKPAPASAAEATTEPAVEPVAGGSDPLADAHMLGIAA